MQSSSHQINKSSIISWTRAGAKQNPYLYNEGSELNATSGFYDLPFRNYDASLGRFFQVDPLAHKSHDLTPYHYTGNNPVNGTDPSGLMDFLDIGRYTSDPTGAVSSYNQWDSNVLGAPPGGGGGGARVNA